MQKLSRCGQRDLLDLQITDDGVHGVEDLINERHHFTDLNLNKVTPTLGRDLYESVACHVLDPVMRLCTAIANNHNSAPFASTVSHLQL